MGLEIVNSLDEESWRAFVDQHPSSNIFHTPEMFHVFERTKGYKPILWAVVDNNNHPLALLLPVQITIKGGIFYYWTTRAVAFGGVLSTPGPVGKEALNILLPAYHQKMQRHILFTELRNLSDMSEIQPVLNECKFKYDAHMNFLIDLEQSGEALWHNITKSGRQTIRTSSNKGMIIEEATDRRLVEIAYQLLQKVYTRTHVPLTDISLFNAAYDILAPLEMFKLFLARIEDRYIGACFILQYKGKIIDWYAGSDRTSGYNSGELLIWKILKWGKEYNFHEFDFGGGGKPDEEYGPRRFKAKFGGKSVSFGRNICIHSPYSYQISKKIYSLMRNASLELIPNTRQQQYLEIPRMNPFSPSDQKQLDINLVKVNSLDENIWRQFVDRHPNGNIFHTPEMFQVFNNTKGHQPKLHATLDDNGQVQALLLPVHVTLSNGLLHSLTTRSIAYGGVLCSKDQVGEKALITLLNSYSETINRDAIFTDMRNLSDTSTIQPVLTQCGYMFEDHLDYLISLDGSTEEVLQRIGARTRKHIRKTLRKGKIIVEEMHDSNLLPVWYELVQKSYRAAWVPLADITLFEAAFKILQPKRMVQFWLARIDKTYIAASVELLYKDLMYGWYSGLDRKYAKEMPGEMLMWHILEWGTRNGYKTYDFGGAGKPDEEYGVRDFKAKFGGQLVNFGRNKRVHAPCLLTLSTIGYKIFRKYLNNLPQLPA
jgi:lipid II:glycine glycyltransferase (peptidoglycan interpeptide bridge formation enzyme)